MSSEQSPVYLRMTIRDIEDEGLPFFSNENESEEPLQITPGEGQIFPKIDEMLSEMKPGQRKTVTLEKEEAFGDFVKEAIQSVPLKELPEEVKQIGARVSAQAENQQMIYGTVTEVQEETATIDFNHPLAGKTIEVEVLIVEAA